MPQLVFGGLIAVIMLGLYIWSIVEAIEHARASIKEFPPYMSLMLNSIGGLISATVVGVLGATRSNEIPGGRLFGGGVNGILQTIGVLMPSLYILVWMICGVLTVVYGMGLYPDVVEPLTSQGKVWLGTAIASVYAYFGINPNGNPTNSPGAVPFVAKLTIPETVELSTALPSQQLTISAADAGGNPVADFPHDSLQWTSSDIRVATVDQKGLVTRAGEGVCEITAAAVSNGVVSNVCKVTCLP